MADPIVVRNERGERVVITDEHRAQARRMGAEVDAHNRKNDMLKERRYHEDLDSIAKDTIRKQVSNPTHFIIGKGR